MGAAPAGGRRQTLAFQVVLAQARDDGRGVGPHATPQIKRLGCLLDQHAEAVDGGGALRACEVEERRVAAVHHVVGQGVGSDNARRQRRQFAGEAGGGGVDDEVERCRGFVEPASRDALAKQLGEFLRAADGAVGDDKGGGLLIEQRLDHATCRATGAEQQDAFAGERAMQVAGEVGNQAGAVGVVTENAVGVEFQRVDRAGTFGARAQMLGQLVGFFLERYGDVGPAPARRDERGDAIHKAVERRQDGLVRHVLPGLAGERSMNLRGFGVGDGVPENGVAISHGALF